MESGRTIDNERVMAVGCLEEVVATAGLTVHCTSIQHELPCHELQFNRGAYAHILFPLFTLYIIQVHFPFPINCLNAVMSNRFYLFLSVMYNIIFNIIQHALCHRVFVDLFYFVLFPKFRAANKLVMTCYSNFFS